MTDGGHGCMRYWGLEAKEHHDSNHLLCSHFACSRGRLLSSEEQLIVGHERVLVDDERVIDHKRVLLDDEFRFVHGYR